MVERNRSLKTVAFCAKDIPPEVRDRFRMWCLQQEVTMKEGIRIVMRKVVKDKIQITRGDRRADLN